MLRADLELFGHIGDNEGLTDCLPALDRQRLVGIGVLDEAGGDKILPRHFLHGAKHGLIADPAPAQRKLEFHALNVVSGWLCGHCCLALLPYYRRFLPFSKVCYTLLHIVNPAADHLVAI
jgi:hypothetical protein